MRENLTSSSYGEGLETEPGTQPPRQSLTRQILFKQLRSYYHLEAFRSRNPHIVHALIYSALLTMLASRRNETLWRQRRDAAAPPQGQHHPEALSWLRLASVLTTLSAPLLHAVLRRAGLKCPPIDLTALKLREATDPNHDRGALLQLPKAA